MAKLTRYFFGTLRGRLVLSVALVHAVMMSVFIIDLTMKHRDMQLDQQEDAAIVLAQSLSVSSAGWIVSDDIAGLQELIDSQAKYPEIIFAMLCDDRGLILAHTDPSKTGMVLLDLPNDNKLKIIDKTIYLVDVIAPAILNDKIVGWVRVGIGKDTIIKQLDDITFDGLIYIFIAILVGSFIAWIMGKRITRRLYLIQNTINKVSAGDQNARSNILGNDEANMLAMEFNTMLDKLSNRDLELNESESRFKKLFNASPIPMALINMNGKLVEFNSNFEEIVGYKPDELSDISDWFNLAYPDPDYRNIVMKAWNDAIEIAIVNNVPIEPKEAQIVCKNGETRSMVISGSIINNEILAAFYDITERKYAEIHIKEAKDKLMATLDALPDLLFEVNQDGLIYDYHSNRIDLLAMNVNEIVGHNFYEKLPMDVAETCLKAIREAIVNGWSIGHSYTLQLPTGTFWFELSAAVMPQKDNNDRHVILLARDITSRKEIEKELISAKERAEESDKLKSAFLANISHEIRTPMNGILGFANILKQSDLSGEQQQKYIHIIERSGERMLNIINDIVDISRIASEKIELSLKEMNINNLLISIHSKFIAQAEEKEIKFFIGNYLTSENSRIVSDVDKVFVILSKIIKNAFKYTKDGFVEIGCKPTETDDHSAVLFYVKDSGIGIPKNKQTAIFERFIQVDINDKNALQGAGLGLSIAKAYLDILEGKIWVESDPELSENSGSTFYFTLPYAITNSIISNDMKIMEKSPLSNPNLKVLIVEDDEDSDALISLALKKISREQYHAKSGIEAIDFCRNNPDTDLIMMDIRLLQLDGYSATRSIREFNKDIIIIAQTAYALIGDREKSINAGCNDYITKPINIKYLESILNKYFQNIVLL